MCLDLLHLHEDFEDQHAIFLQESGAPADVRPRPLGAEWKEAESAVSGPLFAEVKVLIFNNFETFLSVSNCMLPRGIQEDVKTSIQSVL